jgi:hypothetical protein
VKLLLEVFESLVSPEQREMQSLIAKHGGPSEIRNNDKLLEQLLKESSHLVETGEDTFRPADPGSFLVGSANTNNPFADATASSATSKGNNKTLTLDSLRQELSENVDLVLEKNMEIFERKFETQKRQIEDLAKVVGHEGDRIIAAVTTGPHDRILDPDIHEIWKDMVCLLRAAYSKVHCSVGMERKCESKILRTCTARLFFREDAGAETSRWRGCGNLDRVNSAYMGSSLP